MHEQERQRAILALVQERPVATVAEICALTGASEATIRRDIAALDTARKLRRLRGGAEALDPPAPAPLAGHPFALRETRNIAQKRAIARAAVDLCAEGEAIIINGGTTTFQMVEPLATRQLQVFTNSFPIAEGLLRQSRNSVTIAGGMVYREQNIILSPFDNDVTRNFHARRMFMGAQGLGPMGLTETDPLLIQAEEKLLGQAEELVVLADSSKFAVRSSLILCPLARIGTIITDGGIPPEAAAMVRDAGVRLIVVPA